MPSSAPPLRHDFAPHPPSDALNAAMAARHGGVCLLSFSCGKDSLAAWVELRRHFRRVVPVYGYVVPGLGFVERALAVYERLFGERIVRLPHPRFYGQLNDGLFQPPHRIALIARAGLPDFTWDDAFRVVREDVGLDPTTPAAIGVLASDTPARRSAVRTNGPANATRNTWFPIYDWTGVARRAALADVPLPPDYQMFGRSFDGLSPLYLEPIRRHYPEDYARIRAWFPLIDAARVRHAQRTAAPEDTSRA